MYKLSIDKFDRFEPHAYSPETYNFRSKEKAKSFADKLCPGLEWKYEHADADMYADHKPEHGVSVSYLITAIHFEDDL